MSVNKSSKTVYISEEEIILQLTAMENDDLLATPPEKSDNPLYKNNTITFAQKHMLYLTTHPKVNPEFYLSNLRTMIKIRK